MTTALLTVVFLIGCGLVCGSAFVVGLAPGLLVTGLYCMGLALFAAGSTPSARE